MEKTLVKWVHVPESILRNELVKIQIYIKKKIVSIKIHLKLSAIGSPVGSVWDCKH